MTTPNPIRIARVIARLNIGGPAQHVTLLTRYLGPPDWSTNLIAGSVPEIEGDMAYYAAEHGVEPRYLPEMSREVSVADDVKALWALYRLFRQTRPQVVHTHAAKAGFVARLAAKLAGVPVIVHTFHGHVLRGYFGPAKTKLFRLLERACATLSSCIIAISEANRDDLVSLGVCRRKKVRVIELGLDLRRFADAPRHGGALRGRFGLGPEIKLCGFIGRLVPIKQPQLLLAAAAQVCGRLPAVHFAIIGDGELRAELEQQVAELGLADRVHFAGWCQETPPLVADLDLLALTSANEGTPVAVIESAAAGVPAVSTRVGGVPDVIRDGETGWLVKDQDVDGLTAALCAALSDEEELRRRGQRAQEIALARWDIARLVRDLATLYEDLLEQKNRLPRARTTARHDEQTGAPS